ncbi:hypothetical protein C2E23DRAFT_721816 [Lenzites betulinus]|nr:hypothetical protein C2E23DRAFT_721816 [Lenzites betulinus]
MGKFKHTEDFSMLKDAGETFTIIHDGMVHNPLGAASYVFEDALEKPILHQLGLVPPSVRWPLSDGDAFPVTSVADSGAPPAHPTTSSTLYVHIGAQPNNSPHAGTMVTFAVAFLLASQLQTTYAALRAYARATSAPDLASWPDELKVVVQLDLVDTAPDKSTTIDDVTYQFSQRATGNMADYLDDYHVLLSELHAFVGGKVEYVCANQEQLMRMPAMREAIRTILLDRERLEVETAPGKEKLAIRSACQTCNVADKHGIVNIYDVSPESTTITFYCPTHGKYTLRLEEPEDVPRLELNTPLRNLARALVYMADIAESRVPGQAVPTRLHMRVTGADYAGTYQESLFIDQLEKLRQVAEPALRDVIKLMYAKTFYAPLITDWSGAKLSKSFYVEGNAYAYLREEEKALVVGFKGMSAADREMLYEVVGKWMRGRAKVFRNYSLEYLRLAMEKVKLERAAV